MNKGRTITYYSLLNIPPSSNQEQIEESYRNFLTRSELYAPGIKLNEEEVRRHFPELCEAYEQLLDPLKRSLYDEELGRDMPRSKTDFIGLGSLPYDDSKDKGFAKWLYYLGLIVVLCFALYLFSQLFLL